MAWEWVAPVATALVGVAGVAGTWRASKNASDVQVQLLRDEHASQQSKQTRTERREAYVAFLSFLRETDQLLLEISEQIGLPWERAAKRSGWQKGMDGGGEGFIPDPVFEAMEAEERTRAMDALARLNAHYPVVDRHVNEVRLCGSERVVNAVAACRENFYESTEALKFGEIALLGKPVTYELLNAFREDLGYTDVEASQTGQVAPAARMS